MYSWDRDIPTGHCQHKPSDGWRCESGPAEVRDQFADLAWTWIRLADDLERNLTVLDGHDDDTDRLDPEGVAPQAKPTTSNRVLPRGSTKLSAGATEDGQCSASPQPRRYVYQVPCLREIERDIIGKSGLRA
jgi:hypothetical protein